MAPQRKKSKFALWSKIRRSLPLWFSRHLSGQIGRGKDNKIQRGKGESFQKNNFHDLCNVNDKQINSKSVLKCR